MAIKGFKINGSTVKYDYAYLDNKPSVITTPTSNSLTNTASYSFTPSANYIYTLLTVVTSLTLNSIPNSSDETLIYFTTGTSATLALPSGTKYVGSLDLEASTSYVMSILKGVIVIGKVQLST